jgi:four helix bundle protein
LYGLTQQIRRAAVSVPSNIAEGKGYRSDKDFVRLLLHARGSLLELQTHLLIAEDLAYLSKENGRSLLDKSGSRRSCAEWTHQLDDQNRCLKAALAND